MQNLRETGNCSENTIQFKILSVLHNVSLWELIFFSQRNTLYPSAFQLGETYAVGKIGLYCWSKGRMKMLREYHENRSLRVLHMFPFEKWVCQPKKYSLPISISKL
jgi:hypothetical protein